MKMKTTYFKNNVMLLTFLRKKKPAKKVIPTLIKRKSWKIANIIISPEHSIELGVQGQLVN